MTIKSLHGLDGDPVLNPGKNRSAYCYLFADLANDDVSSHFPGTDDEGTLKRLVDFTDAFYLTAEDATLNGLTIPVPAAFTYFGQFMNHDISAPMGGLLRNTAGVPPVGIIGTLEPAGLAKDWRALDIGPILEHFLNEHESPLNLASLYCDGPDSDDDEVKALYNPDHTFKLGTTVELPPKSFEDDKVNPQSVVYARGAPDIPRWPEPPKDGDPNARNTRRPVPPKDRKPMIADQRNDGNLILSQMHLAFMLVHKKAIEAYTKSGTSSANRFGEARQLVTLHYHWLILNDYLPALLSKTVLKKPLSQWGSAGEPLLDKAGSVPMEFTTAAFRFGHSMVGRVYDYNANFGQNGVIKPEGATLRDLFNFTSHGNMGNSDDPPLSLPNHWVIDWERLTRTLPAGKTQSGVPGQAEGIDFDIAPTMLDHASNAQVERHGSILFRNLVRGFHRRIPFGQTLALACWGKDHQLLSEDQILDALTERREPRATREKLKATAKELGFITHTPAWLYFLCESKAIEHSERVGPTASKIIAATIVGLMRHNPNSVLNYKGGGWHPSQSPLKNQAGEPLDSIRAFLLFATEEIVTSTG